jgi:NDP-4-keto-2,6-dideoxyhexose 3-C-methyltransferase
LTSISVQESKECRACKGPLTTLLDLGEQEVVSLGDKERLKAPLRLAKCDDCSLVQLRDSVNQDFLYRHYYYRSGVTDTMRNHLKGIVDDVMKRVALEAGDVVVDIGANDGTLLNYYPSFVNKIGFEPSRTIEHVVPENVEWVHDYFSAKGFEKANALNGVQVYGQEKAKVITAIAMFYDLEDPNAFLQDIKKVLAPDGLFVIQMNYLPAMLRDNSVDNICHEHLCYYSLRTLGALLQKNGFLITDVSFSSLNGGSFRVFAEHGRVAISPYNKDALIDATTKELELKLDTLEPYKAFASRVQENAYKLRHVLIGAVTGYTQAGKKPSQPKRVYVLGTSTRGSVLMQLSDINAGLTPFAVDRDPQKVGKTYVNNIPIISEEQARASPPDYYLVLPYWFISEIAEREKAFLMNGGKFIVPLPVPYTVSYDKI